MTVHVAKPLFPGNTVDLLFNFKGNSTFLKMFYCNFLYYFVILFFVYYYIIHYIVFLSQELWMHSLCSNGNIKIDFYEWENGRNSFVPLIDNLSLPTFSYKNILNIMQAFYMSAMIVFPPAGNIYSGDNHM